MLTLSPDQQTAFDFMQEYIDTGRTNELDRTDGRYLSVGGLAGTGKTTLISQLTRTSNQRIWVMAFTGKACAVLRRKGVSANTIHSSLYTCISVPGKKPKFILKTEVPASAFIVDEASMISKDLFDAILSFGIPVIFVGDHGQLEPIGGNPNVMAHPDIRLEQIHRQAEGNPIIRFAHHVREGGAYDKYDGPSDERLTVLPSSEWMNHVDTDRQIITCFNGIRVAANIAMRSALEHPEGHAVVGDRVICLRNDKRIGIYNGQQGVITEIDARPNWSTWSAKVRFDGEAEDIGVDMVAAQFNREKTQEYDPNLKDLQLFDYAYAVTAHKAQGSEYDKVLVVEQPCVLWSRQRWAYTAATRAAKSLIFTHE